jgi:hypothetical protein
MQQDIEWLVAKVRAAEVVSTPTVRATQTPIGTLLEATPGQPAAPANEVGQYRIRAIQKNTLLCRSYSKAEDGTETIGESDVEIARWLDFQPDEYHGKVIAGFTYAAKENGGLWDYRQFTITTARAANPNAFNEEYIANVVVGEHIWPEYTAEKSIILAARVTGQLRAGVSLMELPGHRRWEMVWRPLDVCVTNPDGSTSFKRVMHRSSQPFD